MKKKGKCRENKEGRNGEYKRNKHARKDRDRRIRASIGQSYLILICSATGSFSRRKNHEFDHSIMAKVNNASKY